MSAVCSCVRHQTPSTFLPSLTGSHLHLPQESDAADVDEPVFRDASIAFESLQLAPPRPPPLSSHATGASSDSSSDSSDDSSDEGD